jgi:hypothetical protein
VRQFDAHHAQSAPYLWDRASWPRSPGQRRSRVRHDRHLAAGVAGAGSPVH